MTESKEDRTNSSWRLIAEAVNAALPEIDTILSETNAPMKDRRRRATDWFVEANVKIENGGWKELFVSEVYARIIALIDDWYRRRYGIALDAPDYFSAAVEIFGTPFALNVPATFSFPGEEVGTKWVGFPDNVQKEEEPLKWIERGPNLDALDPADLARLTERVMNTANLIRSIIYDLRAIRNEHDTVGIDLADSIAANLKTAAEDLCAHENGRLRKAGFEIEQATEKTLKLAIHRAGRAAPWIHDLTDLADHCERATPLTIDRVALASIPSGNAATNLRYGGRFGVADGIKAYDAALRITKGVLLQATPKAKYNARNARFLIKRPPWMEFDTEAFIKEVKQA